MKYFSFAVISIVIGVIISTLFIVGSPITERMRRLDDKRISDLETIQYQIIQYWQIKEALPNTLSDLTDTISGFRPPRDPKDGTEYEYEKKTTLSFNLCATFSLASFQTDADKKMRKYYFANTPHTRPSMPFPEFTKDGMNSKWNWIHRNGRSCFERTLDTERYPSLKKKY